ncbi:MAG: reductive dehalogenase domain-containing protein [Thermovirgaceae bacterium]|nr:reductive dehalogenase domain-containing protein [Thermovirgaceae bacterium]
MPVDERDTMFARMALNKGSEPFRQYYESHPEKTEQDDFLRSLPDLGSQETPTYTPLGSPVTDGLFRMLSDLRPLAEGMPSTRPSVSDAGVLTRWAKGLAGYLGADDVGVARMNPGIYYSQRGRHEETFGQPVTEDLPNVLVVVVAMDPRMIHKGPLAPEMMETARGYLKAGITAIASACVIREMGYQARAHTDGNYLLVASRAAVAAGLGVFGRSGLVIHRKFGPCIRLSAVTTDMPLVPDEQDLASVAVRCFCRICGRCARFCPGRAIPEGDSVPERENPWPLNAEKCYEAWRRMGTDCGVCISACPFTAGLDWKKLEESQGRREVLERILLRCGGKETPRPFDPTPPEWWS